MRIPSLVRSWLLIVMLGGGLVSPAAFAESGSGNDSEKKESAINARAQFNRANSLAGRGALTRSIPHYEKVLEHAYEEFPSAHYNFAEVLLAKEDYARALIHYQAYLNLGGNPGTRQDAKRGIQKVKGRVWNKKLARLSVDVEPEAKSTISIDGLVVATNQNLDEMTVLAGEYTIGADAVDHHPVDPKTVTLEHEGSASVSFELTKKTFFGKARVSVDQKGATVKFHPEQLEAPGGPDEPVVEEVPLEEPVELQTGKWLLEVTKPDYHRWVRYIHVERDKVESVQVELQKKLPKEIR